MQGAGEGMAEANSPIGKVRTLQRKLYAAAKRNRARKFPVLYDRIYRPDVLAEAWRQVRPNKGAAGIDRETLQAVEVHGVERMLTEMRGLLESGRYRPQAAHSGGGVGNNVQVQVDNLWIRYAHVDSLLVSDGDEVVPGAVVGWRGRRGSRRAAPPLRGRSRVSCGDLLYRSGGGDLVACWGLTLATASCICANCSSSPSARWRRSAACRPGGTDEC